MPRGVDAEWARDRSAFGMRRSRSEKRKDARVAREFEIALPHELNAEQRLGGDAGIRAGARRSLWDGGGFRDPCAAWRDATFATTMRI